jgi:hypothetical protein
MLKRVLAHYRNNFGQASRSQPPVRSTRPTMPTPMPLPNAVPPSAPYPIQYLSPRLRRVVEAIASITQGPAAIAAQSVLSVISLTFASRAKVETLCSPANAACFFVLIALSGERKSAADGLAMGGVNRTVLKLREEHQRAVKEYERASADGERQQDKPVCQNFLVTEPTVEGAFKAIGSGAGFLGWFTDEAASFWGGHSMSKEKQAQTCGILSKFWDGAFFIRPRVTQAGDGYVPPTPTTVNLMFQPILIPDTYGNEFLISQGLLARMLPAWPESHMGRRIHKPSDASDRAVVEEFQTVSAAALNHTLTDRTERLLTLSTDARAVCIRFHDQIEAQLGPGGSFSDISGFASKAPEHACRLAALMTLFEDRDATNITQETMTNACKLVEYHLEQYKHLCAAGKNAASVAHAQTLLDWLQKNVAPGSAFATDRILQTGPVGTRNAKTLDEALAILVQYGWVVKLPDGTVVNGKSRRKAFLLNSKTPAPQAKPAAPKLLKP